MGGSTSDCGPVPSSGGSIRPATTAAAVPTAPEGGGCSCSHCPSPATDRAWREGGRCEEVPRRGGGGPIGCDSEPDRGCCRLLRWRDLRGCSDFSRWRDLAPWSLGSLPLAQVMAEGSTPSCNCACTKWPWEMAGAAAAAARTWAAFKPACKWLKVRHPNLSQAFSRSQCIACSYR